jgi:glycosyltransferase involved in cell wall biosynthesis
MEKQSSLDQPSGFSKKGIKVDVIIPTLNEEQTIGIIIQSIRSFVLDEDVSILVVDGGSTDRTASICRSQNIRFIVQKGKGKGRAIREAVEYSKADIVVFMDGDGTYSASDLQLLVEPLLKDEADMVIGSRTLGRREKGSITTFNSLGNALFNRAINFAMKSSISDSLSGYRALYRKTFNDLVLFGDNFEIEVEMTVEALIKGYRLLEVPIRYGLRKGSVTKLRPIRDGMRIGQMLLFILLNIRPLKFFGILSIVILIAGLYPASQVLYEKIFFGEIIHIPSVVFSSLLFVTATLSLVMGIVSELLVRSRRRLEYLINKRFH